LETTVETRMVKDHAMWRKFKRTSEVTENVEEKQFALRTKTQVVADLTQIKENSEIILVSKHDEQ
jgi:hypothetical protein